MIAGLNIDGTWCSDEGILKRKAQRFFRSLFQAAHHSQPETLQLRFIPSLDQHAIGDISKPLNMDEVRQAIHCMDSYKAPGPDGFQPIFFKTYWPVVVNDVWDLVAKAFSSGHIDKQLAETLIVPIPEVDIPMSFKDFCPYQFMQCAF